MRQKVFLTALIFIGFSCSSYAQYISTCVSGQVDSTTHPVWVFYTSTNFQRVDSMLTTAHGSFSHSVTYYGNPSEVSYTCWVRQCDSVSVDSVTIVRKTDTSFINISPRLIYCDTMTGCDASIAGYELEKARHVTITGLGLGKNLKKYWDMGDGVTRYDSSTVSHWFDRPGAYRTKFYIEDTVSGCRDSADVLTLNTGNRSNCLANFLIYTDNKDWSNLNIHEWSFGEELQFHWDFGDGSYSNERVPSHVYDTFGRYLLCLTVSNEECSNEYCRYIKLDSTGKGEDDRQMTLNVISISAGIQEHPKTPVEFEISPNPGPGVFVVKSSTNDLQIREVTDAVGRTVPFLQNEKQEGVEVRLQHVSKGLYYVSVLADGKVGVKMVVVR